MSEWVYRDCPTCVQVDELEPEDSTNPVDWYGTLHEPIVRCRDCKYYDDEPDLESSDPECWRDPEHRGQSVWTSPNGFCAWGERREEDGTR